MLQLECTQQYCHFKFHSILASAIRLIPLSLSTTTNFTALSRNSTASFPHLQKVKTAISTLLRGYVKYIVLRKM